VEIAYHPSADEQLTVLQASDPTRYGRIVSVLTEFEATPGEDRWRRQRYSDPPAFRFTIPAEGYMVLWQIADDPENPGEKFGIVHYVGPEL
jgi:hypothetical protein